MTKYEAIRIKDGKVFISSVVKSDVQDIVNRVNEKAKSEVWKMQEVVK